MTVPMIRSWPEAYHGRVQHASGGARRGGLVRNRMRRLAYGGLRPHFPTRAPAGDQCRARRHSGRPVVEWPDVSASRTASRFWSC